MKVKSISSIDNTFLETKLIFVDAIYNDRSIIKLHNPSERFFERFRPECRANNTGTERDSYEEKVEERRIEEKKKDTENERDSETKQTRMWDGGNERDREREKERE